MPCGAASCADPRRRFTRAHRAPAHQPPPSSGSEPDPALQVRTKSSAEQAMHSSPLRISATIHCKPFPASCLHCRPLTLERGSVHPTPAASTECDVSSAGARSFKYCARLLAPAGRRGACATPTLPPAGQPVRRTSPTEPSLIPTGISTAQRPQPGQGNGNEPTYPSAALAD